MASWSLPSVGVLGRGQMGSALTDRLRKAHYDVLSLPGTGSLEDAATVEKTLATLCERDLVFLAIPRAAVEQLARQIEEMSTDFSGAVKRKANEPVLVMSNKDVQNGTTHRAENVSQIFWN